MALPARERFAPPHNDVARRGRAFDTCLVAPALILEPFEQRACSGFRREGHGPGIGFVEAEGDEGGAPASSRVGVSYRAISVDIRAEIVAERFSSSPCELLPCDLERIPSRHGANCWPAIDVGQGLIGDLQ